MSTTAAKRVALREASPAPAGTIMFVLFRPLSIRMIMKSGVLEPLRQGGARIVLLSPLPDDEKIQAQLGRDIILEPLDRLALVGGKNVSLGRRFMRSVRNLTYNARASAGMGTRAVHFYLMRATGGDVANHDSEMEDVRWFPLKAAIKRAAYKGERQVIERAAARLA